MNYFLNKKCICGFLACVVFASCIKKGAFDFSNTSLQMDGTWGIALVNGEVAFTDFTIDSAINIVSEDNKLKIVYQAEMASSGKIKDLFPAEDYEWNFSLPDIQVPATAPYADTLIFSGKQDIVFYGDTANVLIDTAVFNEGLFEIKLNSPFEHGIRLRLKSANFHYPNGKTLDTLVTIPPFAMNYSLKMDLKGVSVKLKRNALPCEIEIFAYNYGIFTGTKKGLSVDVYGTLYAFKFIEGKVAALSEKINDTLEFVIGNEDKMAFWVKDIRGGKIRLNTFNSFGAGMTFTADSCKLIANGGTPVNLLSQNSVYAIEPAPNYFTTKKQTFTIPINDFAIANKNVFRFVGSVRANAPGIKGASIWAWDTSHFSIEPTLELPLDLNLNYFVYRDTIAQDMSGIALPDSYKNLTFRIEIGNDFPIELNAQLYFLDKNYRIVDSLFPQPILVSAAKTNPADGKTLAAGSVNPNPLFIEISDARLNNLNQARYLYINARATSNNQQAIVRSDQKLKLKVGVKTTIKTKISK